MLHFTNSLCTSRVGVSHWHEKPARKIFFKIKTQLVKPERRDTVIIICVNVNVQDSCLTKHAAGALILSH